MIAPDGGARKGFARDKWRSQNDQAVGRRKQKRRPLWHF
jgi:hypothetical protein